jgi:outer membrane protein assembly factor BamD (BamD/ComL family)
MRRENAWFVFGLALIVGVFAIVLFKGPTTEQTEMALIESQQHYEEAQKAYDSGDLELALAHLESINERTPAWYESRDFHWQIKAEINTYARARE